MQTLFYIIVLQICEDSYHVSELSQLFQPVLTLCGCQSSPWPAIQFVGVLLKSWHVNWTSESRCSLNSAKFKWDYYLPWCAVYTLWGFTSVYLEVHVGGIWWVHRQLKPCYFFSCIIVLSQVSCILQKNSLIGESTQRISHFLIFFFSFFLPFNDPEDTWFCHPVC